MDPEQVGQIIEIYARHGWELRRALLLNPEQPDLLPLLAGAEIGRSDFDGLWFTRSSSPGTESWELRRVAGTPYALVVVIDDDVDDDERESRLEAAERKMSATLNRGN